MYSVELNNCKSILNGAISIEPNTLNVKYGINGTGKTTISKCKVVGDRKVEYQGKEMSLTAATKLISGKKYSIAGSRYFKYKGEWLNDIRARIGF